ncbi:DUF6311 domain-containing protein [Azovibrio restrictus]|uniref:DUF6311 domain-containing protein n=1 Tax=Azovibrio restrictus TaxID=146938 RepID=UPI0004252144|nr:DUF6311 domain-containing protein [Azovibrio restrictus]
MWANGTLHRGGLSLSELFLVLGFALFYHLYLFGPGSLDPGQVAWLLHGDPAQHYLGWQFFRHEAWSWPPGRIEGFGWPEGSSLVFTDAIPLLALPGKLLSPWMGGEFQYFGPWILASLILQGYWALRLLAPWTPSPALRFLAACLFILSPPLFLRGYGHESLMAHWLLLAGLHGYLSRWRNWSWSLLLLAAALTHSYLLLMVLGLWGAALLENCLLAPGRCWRQVPGVLAAGAVLLAGMLLAGYFIPRSSLSGEGYGFFSMNILAPVQQVIIGPEFGRARLMPDIPVATGGQYEGYLYLGAGFLFLALLQLLPWRQPAPAGLMPETPVRLWPLVSVALLFWGLALSPQVTLGPWHLFTLPLPELLQHKLAIFRSSGRFGWLLFYLLCLGILVRLLRRWSGSPWLPFLLILALVLQVVDMGEKYRFLRQRIQERGTWSTPLADPAWHSLAAGARQLMILPPFPDMEQRYVPYAQVAARHGLATNAAHGARGDKDLAAVRAKQMWADLQQGHPEAGTLYIISDPALVPGLPASIQARLRQLDGQIVLPPSSPEP